MVGAIFSLFDSDTFHTLRSKADTSVRANTIEQLRVLSATSGI